MTEHEARQYRPEVDGLRAIAILSVLGFHLGFSDWSGGFVGVDVFFVLSGYLICGQIYGALLAGTFSAPDFFARRIRRLSTAAFACFLVTGLVAGAIFIPFELPGFIRNLIGSITFTNNILLAAEAGYFAPQMEANPLLHTWSLAIEEQFYILLPLLIFLTRRSATAFAWSLALIFLLSLSLVLLSGDAIHSREARYFATDFRVWELALGGLTAILLRHRTMPRLPLVPLLGLLALAAPVFLIEGTPVHPGNWAVLVCFGTVAVLIAGRPATSLTGRILATRVPRYLGRISYGTYLWHWPLIVFVQYVGVDLDDRSRALLLIASLALGAASHHFIENPLHRLPVRPNRNRFFLLFLAQTLCLALLALGLHWKARSADPAEMASLQRILDGGTIANPLWQDCWFTEDAPSTCTFGTAAAAAEARPVLLWGDSMANSALPAFDSLAAAAGRTGRLFVAPSCPPLLDVSRDQSSAATCLAMNRAALAYLATAPATDVFLFARWAYYAGGYSNDLDEAAGQTGFVDRNLTVIERDTFETFAHALDALLASIPPRHRVTLIGPAPEMPHDVPSAMLKALRFGDQPTLLSRDRFAARTGRTIEILAQTAQRHGVAFIDLTPDFCDDTECPEARDGLPIFADQVHLSALGNEILLARLTLDALLPANR